MYNIVFTSKISKDLRNELNSITQVKVFLKTKDFKNVLEILAQVRVNKTMTSKTIANVKY